MDSLLSSYGSDEDDEESATLQPQQPWPLPSPSVVLSSEHSVEPPVKRPRFASLPPPKHSPLPLPRHPIPTTVKYLSATGDRYVSGASEKPTHEATGEAVVALGFDAEGSFIQSKEKDNDLLKPTHMSALLGSLPPPKTRRTVEFRPPVNMSLLQNSHKDEDRALQPEKPPAERSSVRGKVDAKSSGLAAILPPPKHSLGVGTALGGGSGTRRHTMETLPQSNDSFAGGHKEEIIKPQNESELPIGASHGSTEAVVANFSAYHNYAGHATDALYDQQMVHPESVWNPSTFSTEGQNVGPYLLTNQMHGYESQLEANPSLAGGSGMPPEDPLEQVLKRERRRRKEEASPVVLQVKQDDLTAGKIREDQLRVTGIAFGPSYKPVSANKDKPSKLHRRKHQIGSLYFDMKQKEMELLERRAKGHMTKSETQAKYGW
ncbi:hypothetical protein O6H91_05G035100 [Diphasiastrum complanatum]|uniref:Uncharacterized protein n=6 Tax=Diphasiastrum complanatum TaxID=34168 RepID=A0ACC2DMI6_DIPCM|nr:hypothetical protein O6H91_05G035100 [Diphasiastrum complanatum]KAJ7555383.1 hypothetical protein O6H91_05G035100 [Diphasiastrum complanatum]KAJ7555384.1 hypothetical protein O6H91_05G035100 [Diphasiastrum complanatum]KAJ7555385.1 hypothetical protein O6H91_05G035100 [Diphasiastrum complanatum]KAJ7555386.1 hypothetical protein O6H91_05G035100 [Diphasiastrum complanatum]